MSEEQLQLSPDDNDNLFDRCLSYIPEAVRYSCNLYGYRISIEEFEDLCQDIIILLIEDNHRRLQTFRGKSSARTWIFTVVRHYLIDHPPKNRNSVSLEGVEESSLSSSPSQDRTVLLNERREFIRYLLSQMPKDRRMLIELSILGYGDSEISNLMGIPAHTVRQLRYNIVQKLKLLCNRNDL